ncbi:Appr-1-p processing protein [Coprothermobacteraceae bacterium]|nr:Appr-1-p processing protein [Coprothermobacteraceae bacterium]
MRVFLYKGDITKLDVEAVINAANGVGPMGGGVAYAIKQVGGSDIEEEAIRICEESGPFAPGQVYVTSGGRKWKYVIHAVTMTYPAEPADYATTSQALINALQKAAELGLPSVAVPALGMGIGGLKPAPLADVFASAFKQLKEMPLDVYVAAFDDVFLGELAHALD